MIDKELVGKLAGIIKEQIIDWACKESMADYLLEGIIREELIPIIRKAERERISDVCFKIEKERGIHLPVELWQALKGEK